jgi:8-oxo-dGTP pyrophosphatase MutT (NUDIX family)
MRRAAVAALLRWDAGEPEVLLMKRAEHDGDRWSGQVSMPGGREDPGDPDLEATARRETLEELGVDLAGSADLVGRLDPVQAMARGKIVPMTITPFVFAQTLAPTIVGNREVASWFWLPLGQAARGELDSTYTWRLGPAPLTMPAWRYQDFVIWGLTYRMLRDLLSAAG